MGRTKGSGSVFFRKDRGVWVYRYWVTMTDGRRVIKQGSASSKREAHRQVIQQVRNTAHKKVHYSTSVKDWLDVWIERANGNEKTKSNYRRAAEEAKELLGHILLSEVTAHDVEKAMARARSGWNATEMRKVLRLAFKEAQRKRRIPDNPAEFARPPKYEAKHIPTVLTAPVMMKILESEPDEVYRTFFAFLWVTGARPWIEAAPLMWDDILKQDDGYYFRGAKTKKGREPRPIPNWFVPHIEKLGGTGRVFPGNMDQSKVAKHWKNAIEKAGVPHTRIYDLRHSRATLNAQDGVEPQINAALLGQTDSRTTQRYYVHIQQNSMRNAVEKA